MFYLDSDRTKQKIKIGNLCADRVNMDVLRKPLESSSDQIAA